MLHLEIAAEYPNFGKVWYILSTFHWKTNVLPVKFVSVTKEKRHFDIV